MTIIEINKKLKAEILKLEKELMKTNSFEEIKLLKSKFINKNENLMKIKKSFGSLDQKEQEIKKSQYQKVLNKTNPEFLNLETIKYNPGTKHPLTVAADSIKEILNRLGYSFLSPIEIETTNINFDNLNIPKDHPSRKQTDTFYFDKNVILRPQATNMTARYLNLCNDDQIKTFTIGKTYRNDSDDATHSHQFQQIDIFNVSKNGSANISTLKWLLEELFLEFFDGKKVDVRFRPSYFPFTTPSYEVDMSCHACEKKGCKLCKNTGWIEVLGCGMLHPEVIRASEKDPDEYSGFAIGIGLERMAMLKWGIEDIRDFYSNHIDFLKQFN